MTHVPVFFWSHPPNLLLEVGRGLYHLSKFLASHVQSQCKNLPLLPWLMGETCVALCQLCIFHALVPIFNELSALKVH